MARFDGGCHCGAITVCFISAQPPAGLIPRADQCGFCRRHNAAVISDPNGTLAIAIADLAGSPYRFGLNITDFHVCRNCGVFVAATGGKGAQLVGVVNIHALNDKAQFSAAPVAVSFDGEGVAERHARREHHWTPATVTHVASTGPAS